ncbi:alpha/beta fold hydrolase [Herbaspirillum lusitanum]|uniref:Alpha/beta fold hydrolase n=1 Tax=Herbaspirillum lusitanum TaxID=213312 RepID=A0ABW9A255_9BURK
MISRIARTLLLTQCGIALLFYLLLTRLTPLPAPLCFLACVLLVLLLRAMITVNSFALTWPYRGRSSNPSTLTWPAIGRLFAGEFAATMVCSSWGMPFKRFDQRVYEDSTALPVLLVHGYGCNSGYWHWMSRALQEAHITHYALDMEPVFGSIDGYAPLIHEALQRVIAETGQDKIVLLAHSMGGLAARAYLRDHGTEHVARVITLGSPHHGTAVANFGVGINCGEMNWLGRAEEGTSSEWLQALAATEDAQKLSCLVSIYSLHDNIITPQISAKLEGANNIALDGIGHVALALDPGVQHMVIEEIHKAQHDVLQATSKLLRKQRG